MHHAAAVPFRGDPAAAFDLAAAALVGAGFRLTDRTPTALDLAGHGMTGSRQSPLLGATRVTVTARTGELALDADLGGVRRMAAFVRWFPPALCLGLAGVLGAVFAVTFGGWFWVVPVAAVTLGNALLWAVLGPVLAGVFRRRTVRALDDLLASMAAAGEAVSRR